MDPPPLIKLDDLMSGKFTRSWTAGLIAVARGWTALPGQWKGIDNTPDATSWELPEHLTNAPNVVQAFHHAYPDKPAP